MSILPSTTTMADSPPKVCACAINEAATKHHSLSSRTSYIEGLLPGNDGHLHSEPHISYLFALFDKHKALVWLQTLGGKNTEQLWSDIVAPESLVPAKDATSFVIIQRLSKDKRATAKDRHHSLLCKLTAAFNCRDPVPFRLAEAYGSLRTRPGHYYYRYLLEVSPEIAQAVAECLLDGLVFEVALTVDGQCPWEKSLADCERPAVDVRDVMEHWHVTNHTVSVADVVKAFRRAGTVSLGAARKAALGTDIIKPVSALSPVNPKPDAALQKAADSSSQLAALGPILPSPSSHAPSSSSSVAESQSPPPPPATPPPPPLSTDSTQEPRLPMVASYSALSSRPATVNSGSTFANVTPDQLLALRSRLSRTPSRAEEPPTPNGMGRDSGTFPRQHPFSFSFPISPPSLPADGPMATQEVTREPQAPARVTNGFLSGVKDWFTRRPAPGLSPSSPSSPVLSSSPVEVSLFSSPPPSAPHPALVSTQEPSLRMVPTVLAMPSRHAASNSGSTFANVTADQLLARRSSLRRTPSRVDAPPPSNETLRHPMTAAPNPFSFPVSPSPHPSDGGIATPEVAREPQSPASSRGKGFLRSLKDMLTRRPGLSASRPTPEGVGLGIHVQSEPPGESVVHVEERVSVKDRIEAFEAKAKGKKRTNAELASPSSAESPSRWTRTGSEAKSKRRKQ